MPGAQEESLKSTLTGAACSLLPAEQSLLEEMAAALDRRAAGIAGRWLERLRAGIDRDQPGLPEQALGGLALGMVHGLAERLRRLPAQEDTSWSEPARRYAQERRRQGLPLPGLIRELQALQRETYLALRPLAEQATGRAVYTALSALHQGLDAMNAIAAGAYAQEHSDHELARAHREQEVLYEQAQQRLAELDAILTSLPDPVIIYAPDGTIVRSNEAAEQVLGNSILGSGLPLRERALQQTIQTAGGKPYPLEEMPIMRALRGETVHGAVMRFIQAGRTQWLSVSAAPIRPVDHRLQGAVAIVVDITPLKELEAVRTLQEQRDSLLRGISHHLRTRLTVVQGRAQLLLRSLDRVGAAAPRERENAQAIVENSRRMNAIIQDLIDATRLEARELELRRQPIDLRAYIYNLRKRLPESMPVERIHIEAPEGLPPVNADPRRLERILVSLISNALKYSAPDTIVTIRLRQSEGQVITEVEDHGRGIPEDRIPAIFQRYYPTETAMPWRESLGLSLYITRMLVEAHGGRIWVRSQVGVGSTFYFSLPVAQHAEEDNLPSTLIDN